MTRSTVPGYSAVAASPTLVAAEPVTTVPMPAGGRPVGAWPVGPAWALADGAAAVVPVVLVVADVVLGEPHALTAVTPGRPGVVRMAKRRLIMICRRSSRAGGGASGRWAGAG